LTISLWLFTVPYAWHGKNTDCKFVKEVDSRITQRVQGHETTVGHD